MVFKMDFFLDVSPVKYVIIFITSFGKKRSNLVKIKEKN